MSENRIETDSLGKVDVPADKPWGARTQRSLEHFSMGQDAARDDQRVHDIETVRGGGETRRLSTGQAGPRTDLAGLRRYFRRSAPRHVPFKRLNNRHRRQFNVNVNEVVSNRCCPLTGTPFGSKPPVYPNDRQFSVGEAHCRRRQYEAASDSRGDGASRCDRRGGGGVGRYRHDRPDPYAGSHAAHAGAGVVRLCLHAVR